MRSNRGRCSWLRLAWASWFGPRDNNNRHHSSYVGRHRREADQ
jgi:hypothetical protein